MAVNANSTGPELDEQKGLANLVKGLFSMYRNPAAHEPRLRRTVTDDELLELLTTLSMVHRRLDGAHIQP
ncbi:TIGR02391 family protein [Streptomyces mirabilis]|uniref:TIGR02391 family protein n=1 Tax=Streptomyces mirabilis TaxID=68239 RepID=UPI003685FA7D